MHCFYLQHSKRQPPHALCPNTRPPQERVMTTKMSEIHDPNRVWMGDIKCLHTSPRGCVVTLWSQLSPKHTLDPITSSHGLGWCRCLAGSSSRILANSRGGRCGWSRIVLSRKHKNHVLFEIGRPLVGSRWFCRLRMTGRDIPSTYKPFAASFRGLWPRNS